jgi:alpha-mannosidase
MITKKIIIPLFLLLPAIVCAQAKKTVPYDISKDKVLYTIGYSHLDTEWNWDYQTTINECIKNIMTENFHLFEKYPDYVFNFTGSRRYHMMKEYYPELYERVIQYIKQGRWYVSGSSVDEGEVNMSSSEALIRQVLYGNNYFRKEFGVESHDYMLPDCFGFLANMPSIWSHCGLIGFSTQKLTWRSAVGVPFNVGLWYGPDGKSIVAALNAGDYTGKVVPRLDLDNGWNRRLDDNFKKYGFSFDFRYFGVGDMGGAPRERDVKNVLGSIGNSDSKFKVVLTSSDQMFKEITPDIKKKLPTFTGDLLLIEHSAGSLTSQAFMKRMNRKNELLAQAAEQLASISDWMGIAKYPHDKMNNAWELVLGSQFHDILPGTSIPKAYEYAWNDEFIAANGFAEVLKNSVSAISSELNTQGSGRSVVVYNPVAISREDVVTAELDYTKLPDNIKVLDAKGKEIPSQVIGRNGNKLKFVFLAKIPSIGLAVFDIQESVAKSSSNSKLIVTEKTLENEFYKVSIADNGDITSLYDKKNSRELLTKPARLEFQTENSFEWPAWNMDWKDRKNPPVDFMDKEASVRIVENGPVRIAIEVKRKGMNSEITQTISLSAGEGGKRVEITNEADWQSRGVSLKAAFPFTAVNSNATYNMGVGTIQRNNNNEKKFEVPSKEWFDLTDKSDNYGVSVLEDCKYGSDKPDDNTLRLTLLFTPNTDKRYVLQNSQDWGIHNFKYGLYAHKGNWAEGLSPWQGKFINQPLMTFEVGKHNGKMGKSMSMLSMNSPQVGLMAFKKMEQGGYYIVRVNELLGNDAKGISMQFPGIISDAYEVDGQEQKIGNASFSGSSLNFDISHYTIRSFAVKFAASNVSSLIAAQTPVSLPYNTDVYSFDDNRDDGNLESQLSIPAELIPAELVSEDIIFKMGNTTDGENNAVACEGQKIDLPAGNYKKLYVLAASKGNTSADFMIDTNPSRIDVQSWTGYIGQYYNRRFGMDQVTVSGVSKPYSENDNIAWFASHRHAAYPSKNDTYRYCYIFKYGIDLPKGTKSITLPTNKDIKIFAVTVADSNISEAKELQPLYDDLNNNKSVSLR